LKDFLDIDVGVVTGNNNFFVVNGETVAKYGLKDHVIPLVGRSAQINDGFHFTKNDWENLNEKNALCHLFSLSNEGNEAASPGVKRYLKVGLDNGVLEGFKCRTRKLWHFVPSIWIPDGFFFRQIYTNPRLILNAAKAVSTDTIHRVRFTKSVDKNKFAASFHNSLTFACSEVFGRSYGGGVLELEPTEAEALLIPYRFQNEIDVKQMEGLIKKSGMEAGLDYVDNILLCRGLGLSKDEVLMLRQIWLKLSQRRLKRKKI
jgi:adenine-specific DNA-methyltransferase